MYKILQEVDWSFLVGCEAQQLSIGLYQVRISFWKDVSISITGDFVHERHGKPCSDATDVPTKAATLTGLLGRSIIRVEAHEEDSLALHFDDGQTLVILVDDEPYEAFTVSRPNETIVV